MKAVRFSRYGKPADVLEIVDIDLGCPELGEVIISVEAAPIHLADLYTMEGWEGMRLPLPVMPGFEGVGRIEQTGAAVTDWKKGDRVFLPIVAGAWSQKVKVRAKGLIPAPEGDAAQLSLLMINPLTSYLILKDYGDLKEGDWIIQNAANSNCGRYLISLARMRGIKTVNVVRRESLIPELEKLGADIVLVDGADLASRVKQASDDADIRIGVDAVNGLAVTRLGECLADGGTILCYGRLSGEPCTIPADMLFIRDIRLIGFFTARQIESRTPAEVADILTYLAGLIADGTLRAKIDATYPLDEVVDAAIHARKSGDERKGKVILLPNG